jgi:hypothetical protein
MSRVAGIERLGTFDIEKSKDGLVMSEVFRPSALPRLRSLASAFQRITYHRLNFEVVGKASSLVTGGFVAGFVPDPDDNSVNLERLASSQGARRAKWFDTVTVTAALAGSKLFTSPSAEMRLGSPGAFYIFVDGKPNSGLSLTVSVHWDATLEVPSVEAFAEAPRAVYTVSKNLDMAQGTNILKISGTTSDIHTHGFCSGLNIPVGTVVKLPRVFSLPYQEGSGDVIGANVAFFEAIGSNPYSSLRAAKGPEGGSHRIGNTVTVWAEYDNYYPQLFPGDELTVVKFPEDQPPDQAMVMRPPSPSTILNGGSSSETCSILKSMAEELSKNLKIFTSSLQSASTGSKRRFSNEPPDKEKSRSLGSSMEYLPSCSGITR